MYNDAISIDYLPSVFAAAATHAGLDRTTPATATVD
jgi:hypothetical protein